MSSLIAVLALLQTGPARGFPPGTPRSGVEAGPVFVHFDSALGAEDGVVQGIEAAFRMAFVTDEFTLGTRAWYRRWDVKFEQFNRAPADLDGEAHQLGLDITVGYPFAGPLSGGVSFGGGALLLKHDRDRELAPVFEAGPFARLEIFPLFYVEAGAMLQFAMTEFGGQKADTDHISWAGRLSLGFEIGF
jgi:hypothetical protein